MVSEHEARRIAEAWLREQRFAVELVTFRCVETPRSWIFATGARDGRLVLGNSPIAVRKSTGALRVCGRYVALEFKPSLGPLARLRRWWNRHVEY